jgi:glycosyltransferase involved in cell wall biosynthesis
MCIEPRKQIRVLHAPLNFANQAYVLSEALRREGVDSSLATYKWGEAADTLAFDADNIIPISFKNWLGDEFAVVDRVSKSGYDIVHFWNRTLVYHGSGDNFFNGLDLPYLRMAGLRTAYRFTGYELRRKSLELELNPFSPFRYGFESRFQEKAQKKYLDYIGPYIDAFIVQDPEMQSYLPGARIIPRALNLDQFPFEEPAARKRPLVVHAPVNRLVKGSEFVIKAVEQLKGEGLDFDFQLIEEMSHAQALEWYRRSDILVDQLLIGWYGVVAIEAMAMGKTVIAYIRDDLKGFFRGGMPLVTANPETITAALRKVIKDAELRREISRRGRAFVEEMHDCRAVARSLATLYREILELPADSAQIPDFAYQISCGTDVVDQLSTATAARLRHIPALHKAQFTIKQLDRQVASLGNRVTLLQKDAEYFRENPAVNRFLRFARHCHDRAAELKAEIYSAHGLQALPAAAAVAKSVGGLVYCDVIEIPSFANRNMTNTWHPTNLTLLDHAFEGFLRDADGLLTVGTALQAEIQHYGAPVSVIPNYRYAEQLQPSTRLREMSGLRTEDRLLLSISTMTSGFEAVIEALALLPENVHLATLGHFMPAEYDAKIRGLIARRGVEHRVHLFDEVPYAQLATTASGADIGLIVLDPAIMNHRISLPNRLFDYIAAGLPIVAPDIRDIAEIVSQRKLGIILASIDARCWADGIGAALAGAEAMRANALAASQEMVWEKLGDRLHAAYNHAKSITFFGYRDLRRNNRTMRMARTLVERAVTVTICCPHDDTISAVEPPGVRFVTTPLLVRAMRRAAPSANAPGVPQQDIGAPDLSSARPSPAPASRSAQAGGPSAPPAASRAVRAPVRPAVPAAASRSAAQSSIARASALLGASEAATVEKLKAEVVALRYKARRYDELTVELPALRHQALRFNEIKDRLPVWRSKADRYDRLVSKGWLKFALPLVEPLLVPLTRISRFWQEKTPRRKTRLLLKPLAPDAPVAAAGADAVKTGAASRRLARGEKGRVCILSRKELHHITRVPRMAKALSDAGYGVTVVSLGIPVDVLREMCPEVDYRQVTVRPFTALLQTRLRKRHDRRVQARKQREYAYRRAVAKGGLKGAAAHLRRLITAPFGHLGNLLWKSFFLLPCALALQKADQSLSQARQELASRSTLQIIFLFVAQWRQVAMTRGFAEEVEKAVRDRRFDVVQAHDNYALVAATRLAARDKARLIYDAVELSSHRLGMNFSRFEILRERYERRQESAIFRRTDLITTVGDGLADWYARHYSIRRPVVVRNCRYYWPYQVDGRLRADAGVEPEVRLAVWFGGAYPQQGIEILIDAVPFMAPHIHVVIVAAAMPRWVPYVTADLPNRAADLGVADRVHFLPPRDPNDLVPYVSGADLGVIPRPSEHLNNFFSMPNKFLEMVMARLPVAVSRLGDIVDVINGYEIGQAFDERDLKDVAAVIERMLVPETYKRLKVNVMTAAEEMTWERESAPYVAGVRSLMPNAATADAVSEATARTTRTAA